jgi:hypothetical protein
LRARAADPLRNPYSAAVDASVRTRMQTFKKALAFEYLNP